MEAWAVPPPPALQARACMSCGCVGCTASPPPAGTGLYELWKRGLYRNYPPDKLVDLVARVLALLPPWVRVYRIQRDIPMPLVTR